MPGVNYAINDCSSFRITPGAISGRETFLQLLHKIGGYMIIWKGKLKTGLCILADYS